MSCQLKCSFLGRNRLIGRVVGRVFANGPEDLGSIPGRVIPNTLKMVLDTSLHNTQQYMVRIKGEVEQSKERKSAPFYTSVAIEKEAFWLPSTKGRQLYLLKSSVEHNSSRERKQLNIQDLSGVNWQSFFFFLYQVSHHTCGPFLVLFRGNIAAFSFFTALATRYSLVQCWGPTGLFSTQTWRNVCWFFFSGPWRRHD